MTDRNKLLNRILTGKLQRRELLKSAGVGAATATVGIGSAAAQSGSMADGPVSVGPFESATVNPSDLPTPVTPDDPDIIDEGSGESEEVPLGSPDGGGGSSGPTPEPQPGTTGSGLSIEKEYDGFTTRDVVRANDFNDDGDIDDDEIFFGVPSDNQIATSESHHVTVINQEIGFIKKGTPDDGDDRKGGHRAGDDDYITHFRLEDFFYKVLSLDEDDEDNEDDDDDPDALQFENILVFDPRARYDPEDGRFYVACVEFNLPDTKNGNEISDLNDFTGAFLLAVSSDGDPNNTWTIYRVPPINNGGLVDYPTLGYDGEAVYLAQNFFALPGFSFEGATLTVLNKSQLLSGDNVNGWEFSKLRNQDGSLAFTLQPAAMAGESGSYNLANSRFRNGQTLTIWEVDTTDAFEDPNPSKPTIDHGTVHVGPYANAPAAEQPDTDKKIDTLDTRLMNLAWDGDHLWTAHTTAEGFVRWYELDPRGPTLVQSGSYQRKNWSTFLPNVESNGDSMVMVHNVGAETEFIGVEAAGRTDGFEAGELEDHEVVQSGEVAYNYDDTDGDIGPGGEETVLRWGDYNGVAVDPSDDTYWVIGQYAKDPTPDEPGPQESELYGTRIANIKIA